MRNKSSSIFLCDIFNIFFEVNCRSTTTLLYNKKCIRSLCPVKVRVIVSLLDADCILRCSHRAQTFKLSILCWERLNTENCHTSAFQFLSSTLYAIYFLIIHYHHVLITRLVLVLMTDWLILLLSIYHCYYVIDKESSSSSSKFPLLLDAPVDTQSSVVGPSASSSPSW